MNAIHSAPPGLRRRRWPIVLIACAVLATGYVLALRWIALRVESDIGKAIHPVPAAIADHGDRP